MLIFNKGNIGFYKSDNQCGISELVVTRRFAEHVFDRQFFYKMSSKLLSLSVSPGTVLSVLCLLLYSAGFIRIEVKFNDHEQRLVAVEEVISHIRQGMADTSMKGKEC